VRTVNDEQEVDQSSVECMAAVRYTTGVAHQLD